MWLSGHSDCALWPVTQRPQVVTIATPGIAAGAAHIGRLPLIATAAERSLMKRLLVCLLSVPLMACATISPVGNDELTGPSTAATPTRTASAMPAPTPTPFEIVPDFDLPSLTPSPSPTPSPTPTPAVSATPQSAVTLEPTPVPETPAQASLACDLVERDDLQAILGTAEVIGPVEQSLDAGIAHECRWYNAKASKVFSMLIFYVTADFPEWGTGNAAWHAHMDFVGINPRDYTSRSGDVYGYRLEAMRMVGGRSGIVHAIAVSPKDDVGVDRIGGSVRSVMDAVLHAP